MNLQKLFKAQAELDKHIYEQHPVEDGEDRLAKKILALQVELGECANEWRGFKYWSDDREPRTEIPIDCPYCYGKGYTNHDEVFEGGEPWPCKRCDGSGVYGYKNPLLEEYVDCLHFILSIGNWLGFRCTKIYEYQCPNITNQFIKIFYDTVKLNFAVQDDWGLEGQKFLYEEIFIDFVCLGKTLGFTWEQIEQAYFCKE